MKKRIAFLLIVPLLCVLAAGTARLNIRYMPTGGLLFITADDELFTVRQKTMPDGTKIACTMVKTLSYTPNTAACRTPSPRCRSPQTAICCRSPLRSTTVRTVLLTTHKRNSLRARFLRL